MNEVIVATVQPIAVAPFGFLLIAIAIFPLWSRVAHWWEHNVSKLSVALGLGGITAVYMLMLGRGSTIVHALVEYGQFITLLFALFVVTSGIHLAGDLEARPRNMILLLLIGSILASFIGTTGAAMLMILLILKTIQQREHKTHIVIFTIFMIANVGGLLTALGDPPLFIGYLRGVPFFWTMRLAPVWLCTLGLLSLRFLAIEIPAYRSERPDSIAWDKSAVQPLKLQGWQLGVPLLGTIILSILCLPSIDLHKIHEGTAGLTDWIPWRETVMLLVTTLSLAFGDDDVRYRKNNFRFAPIAEVAALFVGIFLTMVPALLVLENIAPQLPLNAGTFYVFTGFLSSFLDNAPTWLTFATIAVAKVNATLGTGIDPARIGEVLVHPLGQQFIASITLGAVFWGANTYIGNGPNFMVKAVAENTGVKMPSFVGYMGWACIHLMPIFTAVLLTFVVEDPRVTFVGVLLMAFLGGIDIVRIVRAQAIPMNVQLEFGEG